MSNTTADQTASRQQPPKVEIKAEDIFEPHILAKYDPDAVKLVLAGVNAGVRSTSEITIAERRADPEKFRSPLAVDPTGFERVSDHEFTSEDGATIPVKVYLPDPKLHGTGPYGVHLNFHGGGFVLGDLTSESTLCLSMRDGAGVVVIDVNYRHCPGKSSVLSNSLDWVMLIEIEVVWGKCIEDALAALHWTRNSAESLNIKPDSVSIGGISAGAHISIVLQHIARDIGIPLKLCLATVPPATEGLTYKYYTDSPFPSFHEFYRGPILPWASIKFFGETSFPRDKLEEHLALLPDWWVAPLKAKNWSRLCDTFIRTAECDPLRDEGEAYGMKLVAGGNKVTFKRYIGCPHAFMVWKDLQQKKDYDEDSIQALKTAHGTA
ncbi:Alpha/Beta hydrolase protein [Xylariales sp. AK1849]|nr:Alpha/Beta hydrolase protein [Xylariales sp. AK1849]